MTYSAWYPCRTMTVIGRDFGLSRSLPMLVSFGQSALTQGLPFQWIARHARHLTVMLLVPGSGEGGQSHLRVLWDTGR